MNSIELGASFSAVESLPRFPIHGTPVCGNLAVQIPIANYSPFQPRPHCFAAPLTHT